MSAVTNISTGELLVSRIHYRKQKQRLQDRIEITPEGPHKGEIVYNLVGLKAAVQDNIDKIDKELEKREREQSDRN